MKALRIKSTYDIPEITLDSENNLFEIKGRSCPENVQDIYSQVLKWFDNYLEKPNEKTIFQFKLVYYNTASSKFFYSIMRKLETSLKKGFNIKIQGYYPVDDDGLREAGEDYMEMISVPIELISFDLE